MAEKIRCVVMRGGTSRGLFFHRKDLPADVRRWRKIFCTALGTPDPKQVDGLGGGTSSTSKAVVVNKSNHPGIDVDYTFVQVGIDWEMIDIAGNCGNLSAAVGPFAVDEGLVAAVAPYTEVSLYNTNTGKRLCARVKARNGRFDPEGDYVMPGLTRRGSEIVMDYFEPAGTVTGKLLPTGKARELVQTVKAEFPVTIMDCTNPYVFVTAADLNLTGSELPARIDSSGQLGLLQAIRDRAAEKIGLRGEAFPKVCLVSGPQSYRTAGGELVDAGRVDVLARTISLGKTHKTIPLTGAFCLAAALAIPGSLPAGLRRDQRRKDEQGRIYAGEPGAVKEVRIGHPEGVVTVWVEVRATTGGHIEVIRATGIRTARRIMEGYIYV